VFSYPKFDIEIHRSVDFGILSWPASGEAVDEASLGGNRDYMDFRRLTWSAAKTTLQSEADLLSEIENATDPHDKYFELEENEKIDDACFGLDLGVASTVFALSAARCVPFSSCNGGTFDDRHHAERYPLVGFYARPPIAQALLACAEETRAGLTNAFYGSLIVFAEDLPGLRRFAAEVIARSETFRSIRLSRPSKKPQPGRNSSSY
jgi:hypothetical protein